jgi:RHS repeat-associated protein
MQRARPAEGNVRATIRTFIGGLVVIVFLLGAVAPAIAHFGNGEGSDDDDSDTLDGSYFKAGGPETYEDDGDSDDSDSDDDSGDASGGGGSGGGSSSAPDVPSAYQLIQLANSYTDARGSYAAARVRFEAIAATAEPPARAGADTAVERLQVAEERVVSRLTRLEETTARNARAAGEARETAVQRARVSTSMTAGDPVSVATGTFITSETDVSFQHGGIEVAARRRYRSGVWPTGSFGLWTWPYDSRIIRGVTPGAEEAAAEADAALSAVAGELSAAADALARAFGRAAITEPAELEADLSGARSKWSVLSEEVAAARDAATATLSAANFLDASHSDWRAPAAYRELSADAQALLSEVELRLSRADDHLDAFREARGLHIRLRALESDIAELRRRIRATAQLSRRARDANRHALRSADPAYLEKTGAGMLTVIDERGAPQVYRVSEGAAGDSQVAGEVGRAAGPGAGVPAVAVDPAAGRAAAGDRLWITSDGGYLRRRADGVRFFYSGYGLLQRVVDRNGNAVELEYDAAMRVSTVVDDAGRRIEVRRERGRITELVDPAGNEIRYRYDDIGRLVGVTDAVGDEISYAYAGNRLVEIGKPDGSARRYEYRFLGGRWRVVSTADEEGNAEHFRYDPQAGYTEYENPSGVVTRFEFDGRMRVARERYGDGTSLQRSYDEAGNLLRLIDERGFAHEYEYDAAGNRIAEVDPEGHRREWRYGEFGGVISHTDARGYTTVWERDESGNVIAVRYPDGLSRRLTRDGAGRVRTVTDRSGATTRFSYDRYGSLSRIRHPDGAIERFEHDVLGRLIRRVDETGLETLYEYRPDGLLAARARISPDDGEQHRISYRYNERKDRITRTGPRDATTRYRYDRRHKLVELENPLGEITRYFYRADGRLVERTDAAGYTTVFEYDRRGRPVSRRHLDSGHVTRVGYDAAGNLIRRVDPSGAVTELTYSPGGRRIREKGPTGAQRTLAYDAEGNLASIIDARGFGWSFTHDPLGRTTEVRGPDGYRRQLRYADTRRRVSVTGALGHETVLEFDARRRLVSRTGARGETEQWTYDAAGRVASHVRRSGAEWSIEYDGFGRAVALTDPLGAVERRAYDPTGNLTERTDARGNASRYDYDAAGRLVAATDAAGFTTRFELDARGAVTGVEYPDGAREERSYDGEGRLTTIRDERGAVTRLGYDAAGRLEAYTDPRGETWRVERDAAGRIVSRTAPGGAATRYEYDAAGNLTAEIAADGAAHRWEYDALGNPSAEINRVDARREMIYDAAGNLAERIGFSGGRTRYLRDELGRLTEVRYEDGSVSRYAYDADGRLTEAVNAAEGLAFRYDAAGRLIGSSSAATGIETEHRYDPAGNRVALRFRPAGPSYVYDYNALGDVISVEDDRGRVATFSYDERGREVRRALPNGVTTETTYTATGRVAGIVHRSPRSGVVSGEAYVYDRSGRRSLRVDENGKVTAYEYDSDGRLTTTHAAADTGGPDLLTLSRSEMDSLRAVMSKTMPERKALLGAVQPAQATRYEYDERGNRTRVSNAAATLAMDYDPAGRLLSWGELSFDYDAAGNLLRTRDDARIIEFAYGASGRMERATVVANGRPEVVSGTQILYEYDALGRRISREVSRPESALRTRGNTPTRAPAVAGHYLHDGFGVDVLAEVSVRPGASTPAGPAAGKKRPIVPGGGRYRYLGLQQAARTGGGEPAIVHLRIRDDLLAQDRRVDDDTTYVGLDERGSAVVTFDSDGRVNERVRYGAFGETTDSGIAYAGKLQDPLTGLYDFGYRDYDPAFGRFTSVDPVKDGSNWYSYVDGDPINRTDPNGLFVTVGPGLRYDERTDRYLTTDDRTLREKSRIEITRNNSTDEFYDDRMQLKVDDLPLTDAAVQSEADVAGLFHATIPEGEYTGHLLDESGTYDDPILLENEDLGVRAGKGYLIHPNEYTNPKRIATARSKGEHIGPWSSPLSEGCQITRGVEPFEELRDEIDRLGYRRSPGATFLDDDTILNEPANISVIVKNK